MRGLTVLVCGLAWVALMAPWTGCEKSSSPKNESSSIEHRASIPIIPRGKVVATKSKGESTLVEIEARMPLSQAVTFYRRQLARENWSDLRVWKAQPGLWGLTARRGMFEITGRIKQLKQGTVSIGFERKVRKRADKVIPPVPKDVPILKDQITWRGPFFQASDGRAEIRGTSTHAVGPLRKTLVAALQLGGWTVKRGDGGPRVEAIQRLTRTLTPETRKGAARELQQKGWTVKLLKDGKTIDCERKLVYHLDEAAKSTRVRLILAYTELKPAQAKTAPGSRPTVVADAGAPRPRPPASANVVPLPKDLTLWPSKEPVLGVKRSEAMLHFSLEHPCDSPGSLLKEIRGILGKRGYRALSGGPTGVASIAGPSRSATLFKGKRAVVIIVNQESETCNIQLTLVRKGR